MLINYNSQLGLRFRESNVRRSFLYSLKGNMQNIVKSLENIVQSGKETITESDLQDNGYLINIVNQTQASEKVSEILDIEMTETHFMDDENSKYFFICESVYKCAELIKIGENFSGRTMKDIDFGLYTYLLGKNKMVRFFVGKGAIRGFYYDDKNNIAFDWGIVLESGDYYIDGDYQKEFSFIMQVLTFVELGDIEVKILKAGQNNGGKRKDLDKITNTSKNTVYIVDSTWNQILIRTEGFAVRGHFRLQPCGEEMKDRKLIWIDAFEKHGYKRRPKGEIINKN